MRGTVRQAAKACPVRDSATNTAFAPAERPTDRRIARIGSWGSFAAPKTDRADEHTGLCTPRRGHHRFAVDDPGYYACRMCSPAHMARMGRALFHERVRVAGEPG